MNEIKEAYHSCRLCPRNCGADRRITTGFCRCPDTIRAAKASLHFYEEPFLSGSKGSGTVFFSGCSLGCIYCQNAKISRDAFGLEISVDRLAEIFLEQQQRGAHNINLVTGTHYTPSIAQALQSARDKGLAIPVIWNSSGYEKPETLRMLQSLVDIFLPDFKTLSEALAQRYMKAPDYPEHAKAALACMVEMTGPALFAEPEDAFDAETAYEGEGVLLQKGVVVRHLLIPGQGEDSKAVLRYLYETYGDQIWISLMSQYTPMADFTDICPELNRTVSPAEYDEVVDYAISLGIENCMIQEGDVATDSFIPDFDGGGILADS